MPASCHDLDVRNWRVADVQEVLAENASLLRFLRAARAGRRGVVGPGQIPRGRVVLGPRVGATKLGEAGRGWPWPSGWGGVLKDAGRVWVLGG